MDTVHYLNISYIFVRLYEIIHGIPVSVSDLPDTAVFVGEIIGIIGVVFSVVLLTCIVYVRIRTVQVEHVGFHELEAQWHSQPHHASAAVKNPQWEMISSLASSPNEGDWRRAILEADIMLATLLTERGYVGDSLGEQLKGANPLQFTTLDAAWEAHRMRNAIAHLGEAFPLSERDTRATIDMYRRVFEEFDYI